jgi:hypothetical protein
MIQHPIRLWIKHVKEIVGQKTGRHYGTNERKGIQLHSLHFNIVKNNKQRQ